MFFYNLRMYFNENLDFMAYLHHGDTSVENSPVYARLNAIFLDCKAHKNIFFVDQKNTKKQSIFLNIYF